MRVCVPSDVKRGDNIRKYWCIAVLVPVTAAIIAIGCVINYYDHTFVWFSSDLPSPQEVASWDEAKRFNTLYKLSRWEGFLSGVQFNRFVRDQIIGLGKKKLDKFRFLEVGVGVGGDGGNVRPALRRVGNRVGSA